MEEERAGALFRALFIAYFKRFDLRYDYPLRDVPSIQQSMTVTLWRLKCVLEKPHAVKGLAGQILLPNVHAELQASMTSPYETEEFILVGYVLKPLHRLGMIAAQRDTSVFGVSEDDTIHLTPLWRKFVVFSWKGIPI
jgi:hypothetical protein